MKLRSTYDRFPFVNVSDQSADCPTGWSEIGDTLRSDDRVQRARCIAVECYPGADVAAISDGMKDALNPNRVIVSDLALLSPEELQKKFDLGADRVFAMMSKATIDEFFDSNRLSELQQELSSQNHALTLVIGTGAMLVAPQTDVLIYANMARWEIQQRQRAKRAGNLGMHNAGRSPAELYKRSFFLDWRAADRFKSTLLPRIDYLLDTNAPPAPRMISGDVFRTGLKEAASRPFRVVPFFDPGPWGGHWMKDNFGLPENGSNYAWCFDCVPEENSLLLGFGDRRVEIPALDLVLYQPSELLGDAIVQEFGAEFPIRFDYLDTVGGSNLSLQVHPLRAYIREQFGMDYTQDESYYMFEAEPDATVYLGLKPNVDKRAMEAALTTAQRDPSLPFPAEEYVNVWPARRHDHFLIPAGTIHCSGRNGVVLEISATPYIFTFKLWDWERLGLDGQPRPVHVGHGMKNIQLDRTTEWVKENLINCFERVAEGDGWFEERTGLHELEFIETRRHWFSTRTFHDTSGTVNVLNLVEGEKILVESPSQSFAPFAIHYGETFIVPAQVGQYTIRPATNGERCATMKAFVRANRAI